MVTWWQFNTSSKPKKKFRHCILGLNSLYQYISRGWSNTRHRSICNHHRNTFNYNFDYCKCWLQNCTQNQWQNIVQYNQVWGYIKMDYGHFTKSSNNYFDTCTIIWYKNRSTHVPDVVINVMCSSGLPGIDMAAGNCSAITCTLLSILQQIHPPPPKKSNDMEVGVLTPMLHWSVQGSDTVSSGKYSLKFQRITVP